MYLNTLFTVYIVYPCSERISFFFDKKKKEKKSIMIRYIFLLSNYYLFIRLKLNLLFNIHVFLFILNDHILKFPDIYLLFSDIKS